MKYLQLVRWNHLLALVLAQFIIKYGLFHPLLETLYADAPFKSPITLNWFGLSLLSLATVCLAGAGYIVDTLYSVPQAEINSHYRQIGGQKVKVKTAFNLFFGLNILAVLIGFYLANMVSQPSLAILFILVSALLYANGKSLKKYVLISPIIVSFLFAFNILSVGLFDLFPMMDDENGATVATFFSILKDYFILLFVLVLIREFIINQRDVNRDHVLKHKSLSISLGKKRMNMVIFGLTLLSGLGVIYYLITYLYQHTASLIYALVLILAPLLFIAVKILSASQTIEYARLVKIMEAIIFCSIVSLGLYQFILT